VQFLRAAEGDAESGYHLVEDEQHTAPGAQIAESVQEVFRRGRDAHVARHGLDDDAGYVT